MVHMLSAQIGLNNAESTRSLSNSGASVSFLGIDAAFSNQAGLATVQGLTAIASAERRFSLAELNTVSIGVANGFKFGTVGLTLSNFGFDSYSTQKLGLSYARKLFDNLYLGGQFDVFNTQIKSFGSTQYITFEIGAYSIITSNLHLAAHIFSPGKIGITESTDLSSRIRIGLKYIASKKVNIMLEFNKVLDASDDIRVGIEYKLSDKLELRTGIATDPAKYSFGFAYYMTELIIIEGGFSNHEVLGSTPGVSIKYNAK
jgi:hypothetical protein